MDFFEILSFACKNQNEAIVKYLIDHDANVNKTCGNDENDDEKFPTRNFSYYDSNKIKTPLTIACENQNEAIVKYLIDHGADVNIIDGSNESPLSIACVSQNEAIVKYLIDHEKFSTHNFSYYSNKQPLTIACGNQNEAIVKYLINHAMVKYLIDHGADVNKNELPLTIVSYHNEKKLLIDVCQGNNENIVKYLINQGADVNQINVYGGETLLSIAFKCLIDQGADVNKSELSLTNVCEKGNEIIFNDLIENGAYIHITNILIKACQGNNEKIVHYLINHGIDVNQNDINNNKSPLMYACEMGNETIVKYLIEAGADINNEDDFGRTPIFSACIGRNETIVKYLIENGIIKN
ncbi:hypothetical protein PIROE2DRAFT_11464 [Piromyces sp. E2]|nr:hypothetical protein PIROE2DRAFT_11464 [Piromyces sp. E2]|eukprot:OUM62311.1 hypothetical protein PIROE2DRAFT_11464 [Piromyces sp. E2]